MISIGPVDAVVEALFYGVGVMPIGRTVWTLVSQTAVTEAAKEASWLRSMCQEFIPDALNGPICIVCDNTAAIDLAKNSKHHGKTKHFHVYEHYIRQEVSKHRVVLTYVNTTEKIADIFTKGVKRIIFEKFRLAIGLISREAFLHKDSSQAVELEEVLRQNGNPHRQK
eukprot:TRINITY_DN850_c0_g1_i4.p3 TRINITY_DN850_c0_g1~~TRINITY_DN850_c0_g1_i4.p3  ORF type:complete len:168 (-),score=12.39 TRINITY_DN850_c0_g1_i4:1420-1923(-)